MAQQQIPESWRKAVSAILATGGLKQIIWDPTGRARYEADFYPDWPYEVYSSFRDYLGQANPTGCQILMDHPPGETWEFLFVHKGRTAYGKILLTKDGRRILIFSAHRPLKPGLSCER